MDTFKLTTVEENEAATARLLETGAQVGADSWQQRVKNQTPHCKFGEEGACARGFPDWAAAGAGFSLISGWGSGRSRPSIRMSPPPTE